MRLLVSIIFMISFFYATAQKKTFFIDTRHWTSKNEQGKSTDMMVNSKPVLWDTLLQTFETHYPKFDTIEYSGTKYICRFHIGETYSMVGACCLSKDLLPSNEANLFLAEERKAKSDAAFDSLLNLFYDDKTFVRFKVNSKKNFRNQCAYFPEQNSLPLLIYLENVSDTSWFVAPKGGFRTNFSTLTFLSVNDSLKKELAKNDIDNRTDIVDEAYFENPKYDAVLNYRFFHNEKFEIEYIPDGKKVFLRIVE